MKDKYIVLIFALLFSVALAGADSYTLLQNGTSLNYFFYSSNSSVPFSDLNFLDICMNNLVENGTENNLTVFLPLTIKTLDLGCIDQFPYRLLGYILLNRGNITVFYDNDFASTNRNDILSFASMLRINAASYDNSSITSKSVYLGNFGAFSDKIGDSALDSGQYVFYIDERSNFVSIVGNSSDETLNALNFLTNIYNANFSGYDCVLLRGCADEPPPSLKSTVSSIGLWERGEISVKIVIDSIRNWLLG